MSTEPSHSASSILIIGSGIFGASTAYHLSLSHPNPSLITLLDRSPFPPYHAASTDINKIVRADYTIPFYMELAYEAMEAWKTNPDLTDAAGRRFFHQSGWVALPRRGDDIAERIRGNFRKRGTDATSDFDLNGDVRNRWNGILKETDFENLGAAYYNPDAGWADAAAAVAKMVEVAVGRGVKYECGDIEQLILGDSGVRGAKTREGKLYEADLVLLATGAWTSQLLSPTEDALGIGEGNRMEKQVTAAGVCVVHYQLDDEEYERYRANPVLIYEDRGEMIPPPQISKLLKFTNAESFTNTMTTSTGFRISGPPSSDQKAVSEKLKQETLDSIVRRVKPEFLERPVDHWRLCWDSVSPSQDILLTKHPDPRLANLYLSVGGSFHSWKFLPIIGKYVVNVLNGASNGEEKDARWAWKTSPPQGRGAHEKVVPRRELRDLQDLH